MLTTTMMDTSHAPVTRELTDSDINWSLPPAPETPPAHPDDLIVDALIDAQSYRTVACTTIHHAHRLYVELEQLRARHTRLIEDYRVLRQAAPARSGS